MVMPVMSMASMVIVMMSIVVPMMSMMAVTTMIMMTIPIVIIVLIIEPNSVVETRTYPDHLNLSIIFIIVTVTIDIYLDSNPRNILGRSFLFFAITRYI